MITCTWMQAIEIDFLPILSTIKRASTIRVMQNIGDINKCHGPLFARSNHASGWIERKRNGHNDNSMVI